MIDGCLDQYEWERTIGLVHDKQFPADLKRLISLDSFGCYKIMKIMGVQLKSECDTKLQQSY